MISKIALISERSMRDLAYADDGSGESNIVFLFNMQTPEGRPWPHELTVHVEIRPEKAPNDSEPVFSADVCYAVAFSGEKVSDKLTPEMLADLWPYVRPELVVQLRRYDLSSAILPLSIGFEAGGHR